jgi:hypothetical protein
LNDTSYLQIIPITCIALCRTIVLNSFRFAYRTGSQQVHDRFLVGGTEDEAPYSPHESPALFEIATCRISQRLIRKKKTIQTVYNIILYLEQIVVITG